MDEKDELENEQNIDADADDSIAQGHDDETPDLDERIMDNVDDAVDSAGDDDIALTDLPITGDLDIDAALASVASLGDELAEREAAELAEQEQLKAAQERVDAERRAEEEEARRKDAHYYPRPPLISLQRGQMTSVLPALVLIALGAWWTFTLSTAESAPSTGTLALIFAGCLGVLMIGYWLTTGRWFAGALFGGITLLTGTAIMVFLTQSNDIGQNGYPLLLLAPAIGMICVAIFSAGSVPALGFTGLLLLVSAIAGFGIINTDIDDAVTDIASIAMPILLVVLVILIILPFIAGRRGTSEPTNSD